MKVTIELPDDFDASEARSDLVAFRSGYISEISHPAQEDWRRRHTLLRMVIMALEDAQKEYQAEEQGVALRTDELQAIAIQQDHIKQILNGEKRTTIRPGLRVYTLGRCVLGNEDKDILVNITNVRSALWENITDHDANEDGFRHKEELRKELLRFYKEEIFDGIFTIVSFYPIGTSPKN